MVLFGQHLMESNNFYCPVSELKLKTILMKLKNHHLSKIENKGESVNLERALGAVVELLTPKIPAHLPMEEQARFAIGYYHQRQALFTKSTPTETQA